MTSTTVVPPTSRPPATTVAGPAATTAPSGGTRIAYAAPVDMAGTVLPSARVTSRASGTCEPGSDVIGDVEVYRCFGGNGIYDPCWSDASGGVACVSAPWSSAVVALSAPGISPGVDVQTTDLAHPWAVQLTSGARCLAAQGAHSDFNGRVIDFGCTGGSVGGLSLLRGVNRSTPYWTYQTVEDRSAGNPVAGPTVQVATAWYAGPPPPSGAPACGGSAVSVSASSFNGMGPGSASLVFHNRTAAACSLAGYPGVAALDGSGRQVAQAARSTRPTPAGTVYIPAGGNAAAELQGQPSGTAGASCPTYQALLVTPPNTTASTRVPVPGLSLCPGFQVAPVYFGNTP